MMRIGGVAMGLYDDFRVHITDEAKAKLRDAPLDRIPTCAIREKFTRASAKGKRYRVRGLNDVILHCEPGDCCATIVDVESPCHTPNNCIEHARMGLQDVTFDERRLKPASKPCDALAGSSERIEAMVKRAASGEQLWHKQE